MNRDFLISGLVAFIFCCTIVESARSQKVERAFEHVAAFSCLSPGGEIELRFRDLRDDDSEPVDWLLTLGDRTVNRGRTAIESADRGNEIVVRFVAPESRKDAVVTLILRLQFGEQSFLKKLYLFPENPFAGKSDFLRAANLRLYDPVGDTRSLLEAYEIPFQPLRDLDAVSQTDDGILLVGEGIRLSRKKMLTPSLVEAVRRGVNVLLLPVVDGQLEIELDPETNPRFNALSLEMEQVVSEFDSRFDVNSWAGQKPVSQRYDLTQEFGEVVIRSSDSKTAWPWLELTCGSSDLKSNSALIICGFGLVKHWEDGPMARQLLFKIIERIALEQSVAK